MYKGHKIILFPTEQGKIVKDSSTDIITFVDTSGTLSKGWIKTDNKLIPQYYYILSDEEIKEGDWFIWNGDEFPSPQKAVPDNQDYTTCYGNNSFDISMCAIGEEAKKVIASNDPKLNLPQLEDKDLQTWCNNPIDTIMVETEPDPTNEANWYRDVPSGKYWEDEPIPPSPNNLYTNSTRRVKVINNKLSVKFEDDWERIKSFAKGFYLHKTVIYAFLDYLKEKGYNPPTKKINN